MPFGFDNHRSAQGTRLSSRAAEKTTNDSQPPSTVTMMSSKSTSRPLLGADALYCVFRLHCLITAGLCWRGDSPDEISWTQATVPEKPSRTKTFDSGTVGKEPKPLTTN